ncbi:MAG: PTS sugar transporter [Deltaproteobacteria bacterium]|nr:PTS sugar transporter [Deltaproteobacteria bacterium]
MIGVVIVTHCRLGAELISTAEFILGRIEGIISVSIDLQVSTEVMRTEIEKSINQVDQGDGIIILTDMFGGTPSNLSLSFLSAAKVEVLTGVNLPMLIKLIQSREKTELAELAEMVGAYGRNSINVAGEVLSRRSED